MALPDADVARRIARSLRGTTCWLAPAIRDALEAHGLVSDPQGEVMVVAANAITADGAVQLSSLPAEPAPGGARIVAWLRGAAGGSLAPRSADTTLGRAWRIFTPLAVLEVQEDKLVVVEVAPGVSARDVQNRSDVRLWVSPALRSIE